MLKKLAREIVEADLAENITSDLLQQTQSHQRQCISRFLIPSVSPEIVERQYMEASWTYIVIRLGGGGCNYRLDWVNHKRRE